MRTSAYEELSRQGERLGRRVSQAKLFVQNDRKIRHITENSQRLVNDSQRIVNE